ncbi:MAG: type II toxin-antitoxin system RelE/ParE family toxin [Xanthobacteraceae bacterium]
MKIEYSGRAVADLRKISADSRRIFGDRVAEALEARIRAVAERISREPLSAPKVEQRSGLHVVPLIRYPFKVFYRLFDDRVRIVHIRHTARRPWRGED